MHNKPKQFYNSLLKTTLLKRSAKCNERLGKWRFFRFFRFHGLILLMLYSPFGKEIKINRAIKSKDNISVLFLYIWLFLIIADICMWKAHSVVQGFFCSLESTIRYVKVEPIYFSSPQKKYGTTYIFCTWRGLESVNCTIKDRPK